MGDGDGGDAGAGVGAWCGSRAGRQPILRRFGSQSPLNPTPTPLRHRRVDGANQNGWLLHRHLRHLPLRDCRRPLRQEEGRLIQNSATLGRGTPRTPQLACMGTRRCSPTFNGTELEPTMSADDGRLHISPNRIAVWMSEAGGSKMEHLRPGLRRATGRLPLSCMPRGLSVLLPQLQPPQPSEAAARGCGF